MFEIGTEMLSFVFLTVHPGCCVRMDSKHIRLVRGLQ